MTSEERTSAIYNRVASIRFGLSEDSLSSCHQALSYLCSRIPSIKDPVIEINPKKTIIISWHKDLHSVEILFHREGNVELTYQYSSKNNCINWAIDWFDLDEETFNVAKGLMT